jgi:hypothetical protein
MNIKPIKYHKIINSINQDIKKLYGDDFSFELEFEKNYYQFILENNFFNMVCEYGIIRTPMFYDYSVITSILKIIISIFEMFYLCCYEIKIKVELEIKVVSNQI